MENTVNQRIKNIIEEHFNNNKRAFATAVGVSATVIENIVGTRQGNPSYEVMNKMYTNANINIEYLMTGEGEKLRTITTVEEPIESYALRTDRKKSMQVVPLYDFKASAGLTTLFNDKHPNILDYISIPNLPKVDGAIAVTGDSMYPLLKAGDIVMYKIYSNNIDNIFWGEMYLISYELDGDIINAVKFLKRPEDKEGYITLVSQNVHHSDKDIKMSSVKALALIKASIRINTLA